MKVGIVATNLGTIQKPWLLDAKGLMAHSGNNLGNLAFWYAADILIDAEKYCIPWSAKRSDLPADIKALVIPAANFISATRKLDQLAGLVRAFDLPCILIGIGAQAEQESLPPTVDQSVIDFLQEVSARTPFIGLRGEFTKKITDELGIKNTRVLGCPSILINPDPDLGLKINEKIKNGLRDGPYIFHSAQRKKSLYFVERDFIEMIKSYPGSKFAIQRPPELIAASRNEIMTEQDMLNLQKDADFCGFLNKISEFKQFLRESAFIPTSIDGWMHSIMQFRASINTRIHGTIMGISAGVPSICVAHDTRTRELAKHLMIPTIDNFTFIEARRQVDEIFSRAAFSGNSFDVNRNKIAKQYCELLKSTGLKPSGQLTRMAA